MKNDIIILRELAAQLSEIAALPIQDQKRSLWRSLNANSPTRPMVMIDQVCWNEMQIADELTLRCENKELQSYERTMRRLLYQWHHFPCDMVIEPFLDVPRAINGVTLGVEVEEHTRITDETNGVISHQYVNQFQNADDIEKVKMPQISEDKAETQRRLALAREVFDGVIEVRPKGIDPYLSIWDPISTWMGAENLLYALVDRPDDMHALTARVTDAYMSMLDQLEAQGLLCVPQSLIHCTGAYTDELPKPGYDPEKPRTQDIWMFGLAQIFSTVSPATFEEYEVNYANRLCERFGLVYYGCCDPLDLKMAQVRKIKNVRKVSMSPWTDQRRGAMEIGKDYVFSRKPNPALLAGVSWQPEMVRKDLQDTVDVCREYGCQLELILKDISTVGYQPQRLWEWNRIAMEVVGG